VVTTVLRAIVTLVRSQFNLVRAVVTTVFNAIRSVAQTVWNAIVQVITRAVNTAKSVIQGLQAIVAIVTNIFQRVVTAVTTKITAAVQAVSNFISRAKGVLTGAGSALFSAGANLIQGLIDGISSKIEAAVQKVRDGLGKIKSLLPGSPIEAGPLKAWNGGKPGKALMDLITLGIRKGIPALQRQAEDAAGAIEQGLVTGLMGGTLNDQLDAITDKIDKAFDAEKISKKAAKNMTRMVGTVRKGLKSLIDEYTKATEDLQALREQHAEMISSISQGLVQELSLAEAKTADIEAVEAVAAELDAHGHVIKAGTPAIEAREGTYTFGTVSGHIRALASRIGAFSNKLQQLLARGIPKELVQEVAALGSDTGSKVADALLSGSDAEVGQLATDWHALTAGANRAGQVMADAYYATGIAANEAIVKGLLDDDRLTKAAETLATKLTKKIRKALKIKSPSRLMFSRVGEPTGEGAGLGVVSGMDKMQSSINRRAADLLKPLQVAETRGAALPGATPSAATGARATLRLTDADLKRLAALLKALAPNMTVQLPTGDPEAAAMAVMNRFAAGGRF
jgi:hypothetical protein